MSEIVELRAKDYAYKYIENKIEKGDKKLKKNVIRDIKF